MFFTISAPYCGTCGPRYLYDYAFDPINTTLVCKLVDKALTPLNVAKVGGTREVRFVFEKSPAATGVLALQARNRLGEVHHTLYTVPVNGIAFVQGNPLVAE